MSIESFSRRSTRRYDLRLPVAIDDETGTTCNISMNGIFVEGPGAREIGAPIEFIVSFSREVHLVPLELHCRGTVARIERMGDGYGIAAAISSHSMLAGRTEVVGL